jgi:hypothetical protein
MKSIIVKVTCPNNELTFERLHSLIYTYTNHSIQIYKPKKRYCRCKVTMTDNPYSEEELDGEDE